MAYPFQQFPTFAEFIQRLSSEHQVRFSDLEQPLYKGDDSEAIAIHFLERTVEGKIVRCVIDIQDFYDRISPSVMRSICTRLKLEPEAFGLASMAFDNDEGISIVE